MLEVKLTAAEIKALRHAIEFSLDASEGSDDREHLDVVLGKLSQPETSDE